MRAWAVVAVLWAGLWLATGTAASQEVSLAPSEALKCMLPVPAERGLPAYDPALIERKEGGVVKVELVFAAPDEPPEVTVLAKPGYPQLVDSVREHVAQLRVPCLAPGGPPARVVQEYVFRPDDGRRIYAAEPVDLAQVEAQAQRACMTQADGANRPEYPTEALRERVQGRFLVRMTFGRPDAGPSFQVLGGPKGREFWPLRESVETFVKGYRLPCLQGPPKTYDVTFIFRIADDRRTLLNDLKLTQYLRLAASYPSPAQFDLTAMGCPFDVRLTHYQPFTDNVVEEVGNTDPARRSFLAWLGRVQARLTEQQQLLVLGETFIVSVPCLKLDL